MTRDERILNDLADHLREKIVKNIGDYADLCRGAGLDYPCVMSELMVTLVALTAGLAANQFHISPAEFATMMGKRFAAAQREQEDKT